MSSDIACYVNGRQRWRALDIWVCPSVYINICCHYKRCQFLNVVTMVTQCVIMHL